MRRRRCQHQRHLYLELDHLLQMHEVEGEEEEEEIRSLTIAIIDSLKNQEIRDY